MFPLSLKNRPPRRFTEETNGGSNKRHNGRPHHINLTIIWKIWKYTHTPHQGDGLFRKPKSDMRLAFFAQYGYSNPVLKMFQGGSRGAVFFFGKRLPLSFPDA